MKKNIKLFVGIIIGVIISTVVGVSATILYQADEVGFAPDDPNWNVNNLESALNDLYVNGGSKGILLWTNSNPAVAFGSQSISLDLSDYDSVAIETIGCNGIGLNDDIPNAINIIKVGYTSNLADRASNDMRNVTVSSNSISFGNAKYGQYDDNGCVIPYKVYGLTKDIK